MPYLRVQAPSGQVLLTLAEARWAALETRRPDLRPATGVQRRVLPIAIETADEIANGKLPRLSLPSRYLAKKLDRGVPALTGEPVPLPIPLLAPRLVRFAAEMASGGAGPAAERIVVAIREGRVDPASLLGASMNRDQEAIRAGSIQRGLVPDLVWLVAELTVSPFAHALQQSLFGRTPDRALLDALDRWNRGYCPACGSWPALGEATPDGQAALRCSFCALAWTLPARGCPFCGNAGTNFVRAPLDPPSRGVHLDLCGACRGYIKTIDTGALTPFPLLAIADVETMGLDVAAMERGYSRPALHEMRGTEREETQRG